MKKTSIIGGVISGLGGLGGEFLRQTIGFKRPARKRSENRHVHHNVRNYFITKTFVIDKKPFRKK